MSEESKEKMRLAKVGVVPWNKGLHLPGPMEGKKHTQEAKEKMRLKKLGNQNHKGKKHSQESITLMKKNRSGIPAWNKGIEMSESFCKRASEWQQGKSIPQSQRDKISKSLEGREKSEEHILKVIESSSGEGFWYGHHFLKNPPRTPRYCEKWKDVNPRVHAFFDYECCECHTPENGKSHIGHHVFYVKEACCWFNDDGIYYTNLNARDHKEEDYCIGENPNYFVILCPTCHGRTNGNFKNRKKWADHFKELIDTKYKGKCYLSETEFKELKKNDGV